MTCWEVAVFCIKRPEATWYCFAMAKLCPGGECVYAYCVFCETAICDYVARMAEQTLHYKSISPKQVQHTWYEGKMVDVVHDLFRAMCSCMRKTSR